MEMPKRLPIIAATSAVVLGSPTVAYAHGEQLPAFLGSGLLTFLLGIPVVANWRATIGTRALPVLLLTISNCVTWWMVAMHAWEGIAQHLIVYAIGMTLASVAPVAACVVVASLIRRL